MKNKWIIIFGGTGGIGIGISEYLAKKGFNIYIIHRDPKSLLTEINKKIQSIKEFGVNVITQNLNACEPSNVEIILNKIKESIPLTDVIVAFVHSISDGNINVTYDTSKSKKHLIVEDYLHTIRTMGTSMADWAKLLIDNDLLKPQSRIIGITSEGAKTVIPNYGAISSAKQVLESTCKYLAVDLARLGITVNLINSGIIDTRALSKLPNSNEFIEKAKIRNPSGRLTVPLDIAKVVYLLTMEESAWITGEVIRVDGGEQLVGFY